tara:strand:- start:6279 stop:6623 length:345 start_codon:yes stop_codon:yes gene_type:complete
VFWDDFETGSWREVLGELGDGEPAALAAVGVYKLRAGGGGGVDVIEDATVYEVAGGDGFLAEGGGEGVAVLFRKDELVGAEAVEFAKEIVAGVGAGEREAFRGFYGEVEFCGEF